MSTVQENLQGSNGNIWREKSSKYLYAWQILHDNLPSIRWLYFYLFSLINSDSYSSLGLKILHIS